MIDLTPASFELMTTLREDAIWEGEVEDGDLGEIQMFSNELSAAQRGNFTDLKRKGLIDEGIDDSDGRRSFRWHKIDMTTEINSDRPASNHDAS